MPDEQVREQLVEMQSGYSNTGSKNHSLDLHLTLLFIGMTHKQDCLVEVGERIRAKPFFLKLNVIDYWRRPRVLWAGCEQSPPEILQLVSQLSDHSKVCGYQPESRTFIPHVTLARKAALTTRKLIQPVAWNVKEFSLLWSRDDIGLPRYQPVKSWPLINS
jgi:2'-5' RNA ligase